MKIKLWTILYWTFFISIIISALPYINNGWTRWKWGYYNIDLIPTILLLIILYIANLEVMLYRLGNIK